MLVELCRRAKEVVQVCADLDPVKKNEVLTKAAESLLSESGRILEANARDRERAIKKNMPEGLLDRLTLTPDRIAGMAKGLQDLVLIDDPIGSVSELKKRPNGSLEKNTPIGFSSR